MNKLTKGAIAGAAGIVLLLGGAGTFALWNDSATVNGGSITAGTLDIVDSTPGQWQDVSTDVAGNPKNIDPATFRAVPGDTLTYTQTVTVASAGNNLLGNFGYTYTQAPALPTGFTATVQVLNGATPISNPVLVTNGASYKVVLTLTFASSTSAQVSQGATVNLSAINLTLNQVRPTP